MKVFVWNTLVDRSSLSFVLRRRYMDPFEPAILEGYMKGHNWPDLLFRTGGADFTIEGQILSELSFQDIRNLDSWHAVDEGIHTRAHEEVKVMRFGKIEKVDVIIYYAGSSFSKLKQGARLK